MEIKTIKEAKNIITAFCLKHNLEFKEKGECGFGRPCVGIVYLESHNWVEYNPYNEKTLRNIEEFYNKKFYDIKPKDAYHKHDCLAVLVNDDDYEKAIFQLAHWVVELEALKVSVQPYTTGAEGLQVLISGRVGYALKIN